MDLRGSGRSVSGSRESRMKLRSARQGRSLGVRLMVAATLAGGAMASPAISQTAVTTAKSTEKDFDIPEQPLGSALNQFGQQSGTQLSVDDDLVRNLTTQGVRGHMGSAAALQHLLEGTGLAYSVAADGTYALHADVSHANGTFRLGTVRIVGQYRPGEDPYADPDAPYKADRLSSSKFTEPVLDTPRTVTVLTQQALQDKNATTLREIARSTAGVTLGSGEGGNAFGDRFFIRGFDARNDVFID